MTTETYPIGSQASSTSDERTIDNIKDMGLQFHGFVESLGQSRELSLAKTKIEEAVMWAVKHITK